MGRVVGSRHVFDEQVDPVRVAFGCDARNVRLPCPPLCVRAIPRQRATGHADADRGGSVVHSNGGNVCDLELIQDVVLVLAVPVGKGLQHGAGVGERRDVAPGRGVVGKAAVG
jgi:hypothetical protein